MSNILTVDDDEIIREMVVAIARSCGCEVDQATNGLEAIEAVKKNAYDLIFMDLSMPVMSGLEAIEKIAQIDSTVPIVVVSGNSMGAEDLEELKSLGAKGYIGKPFEVEDLANLINRYAIIPEQERRETKRVVTSSQRVGIEFNNVFNRKLNAEVVDISSRGMRFESNECIDSGNHYTVSLSFKRSNANVDQKVRVVWAVDKSSPESSGDKWMIGCEFISDEKNMKDLIEEEFK